MLASAVLSSAYDVDMNILPDANFHCTAATNMNWICQIHPPQLLQMKNLKNVYQVKFCLIASHKTKQNKTACMPMMSCTSLEQKKLVLVTGGNKGIGKAICQHLLVHHSDVHVLLGSRDLERGKCAATDIVASNKAFCSRITVIQLDVTSNCSVQAASKLVSRLGNLHGIVNNAAVSPCTSLSCKEIIDTNYFGPRRINEAFVPMLVRPGGRIVNVSSVGAPTYLSGCLFFFNMTGNRADVHQKLGNPTSIEGEVMELDKIAHCNVPELCRYTLGTFLGAPVLRPLDHAYQLSKALLNAYSALHSKLEPGLVINGCCTGFIDTDLVPKRLGFSGSPEEGAVLPVKLLMSPEFQAEDDGQFYIEGATRELSQIPDLKDYPDSFRTVFETFLPLQEKGKERGAGVSLSFPVLIVAAAFTLTVLVTVALVLHHNNNL